MPYTRASTLILGTLPVATVSLAILFFLIYPLEYSFEPRFLFGIVNSLFSALIPFTVAIFAAKAFLQSGSSSVFMLGCGTLALGWSSLIAGWMLGLPGSPNHTVTVHNVGVLLGGLCHFSSGSELLRKRLGERGGKPLWLVAAFYLGIVVVVALCAAGSAANLTPVFFAGGPDGGPTTLRQIVLSAAVILYVSSAVRFLGACRRSREIFFYWYALALLLMAVALGAFLMQEAVGSPISWSGRISQYLAGCYFFLVVYEARKSARRQGFTLEKSLAFFFSATEQNYRILLESVSDAVFCFDRSWRVFLCNSKAETLLGLPRQEIVGRLFTSYLKTPPQEFSATVQALETGETGCHESWLIRGDGGLVPVEYSVSTQKAGRNPALVAVVRDLTLRKKLVEALKQSNEELELRVAERTRQLAELNKALEEEVAERRQVERELRERKERFQALFTSMAQGVFYQNREGSLVDVNDSALEIFGLTRDEFLTRDSFHPQWQVINEDGGELPPEDHPSMVALRTGLPVRGKIAGVLNQKSGEYVWLVITAMPSFRNGEKEPAEVFVTLHDITSLKRLEQELRTSREDLEKRVEERTLELQKTYGQLLHAEKLSAIGSLSAAIAHEFNNPLQSVMTVMKLFRRLHRLEGEEGALMDTAIQECERMRDLIRNLQDFNRPTSGRWAPMNLHAAIDSILLLSRYRFKRKGIALVKEYAPGLPQVKVVADQIKQVLLNLLNNAVDACEDGGGTITIGTAVDEDGQVHIFVRDTGKGIQPEIMARIFEPFFTTKPEVKGTGLGLSVTSGIVKSHGGRITVASEPGKGAVFTVILPISGPAAGEGHHLPVGSGNFLRKGPLTPEQLAP